MKRALVLVLLASAALAAPKPTTAAQPSVDGWQDLRWGMTTAQVMALHPEARPLDNGALRFATQLFGGTSDVWLTFGTAGLEKVELGLHGKEGQGYEVLLADVKAALRERYGEPSRLNDFDEDFRKLLASIKTMAENERRPGAMESARDRWKRVEKEAGEESWVLPGAHVDFRFFPGAVSVLYTRAGRPAKPGAGL